MDCCKVVACVIMGVAFKCVLCPEKEKKKPIDECEGRWRKDLPSEKPCKCYYTPYFRDR